MKKLILLLFTSVALNASAQNHLLGIKSGINLGKVDHNDLFANNGYRVGFTGGLNYEYRLGKHFLLGADLMYTQRGFTNEALYYDVNGQLGAPIGKSVFKYDYLSTPLRAGFISGDKIFGFVNLAVSPAVLVSGVTAFPDVDSEGRIIGTTNVNVTSSVTRFDLSGILEAGGGFRVKDRFDITTTVAFQQSFTSLSNDGYFPNSSMRNYGFSFQVGLRYALKAE